MLLPIFALIISVAPPAPPGAQMIEVDVVRVEFKSLGDVSLFSPSVQRSIAARFSLYIGIATEDIAVFVTDDPNNADRVDVRVDHDIPTGTSAAKIASTLNNGLLRHIDVLQTALQFTGGVVLVQQIFAATIVTRYVAVFPPSAPGPAFTETMIIVITVGGVVAMVALIFIARQCDAEKLNEFTKLVLGILGIVSGRAREPSSLSMRTESTVPTPQFILIKKSAQTGAAAMALSTIPETITAQHPI
jgi:hypothetical protein